MESYSTQPLGIGFIHSAQFSEDSSRLSCVSIVHFYLLWRKYITVEKSAPLLVEPFTFKKDIRAASTLGLLQIKWLWTSVCRLLCEHSFHFSGINAHDAIAGLCGSCMLNLFKALPYCSPGCWYRCTSPPAISKWSNFSTFSLAFGVATSFHFSHSDRRIEIVHRDCNLHFPNG